VPVGLSSFPVEHRLAGSTAVAERDGQLSDMTDAAAPPAGHWFLLPVVLRHYLTRTPRSDDQRKGLGYLIEHGDRLLQRYLEELSIRPVSFPGEQLMGVELSQVVIGDVNVVQELKAVR